MNLYEVSGSIPGLATNRKRAVKFFDIIGENTIKTYSIRIFIRILKDKLLRAYGGCLGSQRRRRTC